MTGRPSTYTEEVGNRICERLVGGETLRQICADPEMPSHPAVYNWIDRFPSFAAQYARARAAATEAMLEDMLEIADKEGLDPQEKRVRIDTRKWAMSKLNGRRYGDKVGLEHTGAEGGPIEVTSTVGLAVAAVKELRNLRMGKGTLPAPEALPEAPEALPAPSDGAELL